MRYVVILCIASLILLACAKARPQQLALGLDKNDIDTTVRPQDDFFRYVNGGWLPQFSTNVSGHRREWRMRR